jgi:hypothetical protein
MNARISVVPVISLNSLNRFFKRLLSCTNPISRFYITIEFSLLYFNKINTSIVLLQFIITSFQEFMNIGV